MSILIKIYQIWRFLWSNFLHMRFMEVQVLTLGVHFRKGSSKKCSSKQSSFEKCSYCLIVLFYLIRGDKDLLLDCSYIHFISWVLPQFELW